MKPKDMKKQRRQEAYMGFMRRKKWLQEKLTLETTSIKDWIKNKKNESNSNPDSAL